MPDFTSTLHPMLRFFTHLVLAARCTPQDAMLLRHTSSGPVTCIHSVSDLNYGSSAPPDLPAQFTYVSFIPGYGSDTTSLPTNQISTDMTAQTNTTPSHFAPIPAVTLAALRPVSHMIQVPVTPVYVPPGMQTSVTGHHVKPVCCSSYSCVASNN